MRLLVVGGSGFLGRNLLLKVPRDWELHATFNTSASFPGWLESQGLRNVVPLRVDLRDEATVGKVIGSLPRPDACLFLAADTAVRALVDNPSLDVRNNILPAANLVRHYRGGKLVFMSSGAVYMGCEGAVSPTTPLRPSIPYAIGKYAAELYVQYGAEKGWYDGWVVLRFFGAYGPHEPSRKITTKLIETARAGRREFTIFGDGKNLIDVMHVDDAVDGLLAVLRSATSNLAVDFASGNPCSLNEFAHRVGAALGHRFDLRHEGESPEYIRFHASAEGMAAGFGVRPRIPLDEGIPRLRDWLGTHAG